jgi:diguanylate cyclase (GGDEF)-like protein
MRKYAYYRAEADFREKQGLQQQFEKEAATDGLTGFVRHPAYAEKLFEVERRRLAKLPENRCMMLVVIDLDDFKLENESHPRGHLGVDQEIIIPIARNLEGALRSIDIKGRPGGDELFLMINDIDLSAQSREADPEEAKVSNDDGNVPAQAKRILSKIQKAIESVRRANGKAMTGSIGFRLIRQSEAEHGETYGQATVEADRASHHSKELLVRNPDVSNISEYKDDLPDPDKDIDYYKHLAKKGLGRVFPTQDLTEIYPYIDAMSTVLAQRELASTQPERNIEAEVTMLAPLLREIFKAASSQQVELSLKAVLAIMSGPGDSTSISVSLDS